MNVPTAAYRLSWLNLPIVMLVTLLQRTPVVRVLTTASEYALTSPIGQLLRGAVTAAALGALHSRAGATTFVQSPSSPVPGTVGASVQVAFTYVGTPSPPARFQIISGALPPGLRFNPTPIGSTILSGTPTITGTPSQAGNFTVSVQGFNAEGLTNNIAQPIEFRITGGTTTSPPAISAQPQSRTVDAGASVTFSVTATGDPAPMYQWRKSDTDIAGATSASLTLTNVQPADAGVYRVVITNSAGSVTSDGATLTVNEAPPPPPPPPSSPLTRIVNLSILTPIASPGDDFTMGFVVGGATVAKPLVIRAAGPSLGALGVGGTLTDPMMEIFAGANRTAENDNWGGEGSVAEAMASVGAFPYVNAASLDAAVLTSISTRDNSVKVSSANNGTGMVIAEIYDATADASFTATSPRLINVSVLKPFGAGFTIGFVIRGPSAKTVLVRAIGPGLAAVGVTAGFVDDPQLTLFGAGGAELGANNDWAGATSLSAAFDAVGAFALPQNSRDAALLVTLPPGDYTVQVAPVAGSATGLGLIEVYEVP